MLLEKNQKKNAETKKKIATAAQAREFIRRVPSSVDLVSLYFTCRSSLFFKKLQLDSLFSVIS